MPMNGLNQSASWGGRPRSPAGDGSPEANGLQQMPQQKPPRPRFQTAQPPAPSSGQPQQPAPTFAQLQAQGQARPAPQTAAPAPAPAPAGSGGTVGGQLQQSVQHALAAPSRYDLPQVQQVRSALQQQLQTDFDARGKSLNDEMARRGLSESTIAGQRYSDLGSEQSHAMADIDAQLLQNFAATQAQDLSASLGAGQNYENSFNSKSLADRELDQGAHEFDLQQALAEKLGLGGLGLQEKQLTQQGSQFGQSLQEQIAARLGSQGLQEKQLEQQGSQFGQSLAEQVASRMGSQGLQERQLAQSGSQFDKSFGLQQAAQALNEKVQLGQMSRQDAELELQKLSQSQSYELGKSGQDIQKQQLQQSGDLGKQNMLLQFLNTVGAGDQPALAAQIAQMLGLPAPKTAPQVEQQKAADAAKKEADRKHILEEYVKKYGWFVGAQKAQQDHPSLFS